MENPWKNINWEQTVPECDWYYFALLVAEQKGVVNSNDFHQIKNTIKNEIKKTGKSDNVKNIITQKIGNKKCILYRYVQEYANKNKIQFNTLPEPYTGDPESKVYLLNMNPGRRDDSFEKTEYNRLKFELLTKLTLEHQLKHSMWYDLKGHDGYYWIKNKTNHIFEKLKEIGIPRFFMIEYFPYHSEAGFNFPEYLPSYEYTDFLIQEGIKKGKLFIIMRLNSLWFKRISFKSSIHRLKNYRNVSLTPNNINFQSGMDFTKFLKLL